MDRYVLIQNCGFQEAAHHFISQQILTKTTMIKNFSFAVVAALGLMVTSASFVQAAPAAKMMMAQNEGISFQTVQAICQEMQNEGVATYDQAMHWYQTDQMTITYEGGISYSVVTPGGFIILVEAEAL